MSTAQEKVLVYHYRPQGEPVVKNGLGVLTRAELERKMEADPGLRSTRKTLSSAQKSVEIFAGDINPHARGGVSGEQNVAEVTIPVGTLLTNLVSSSFKELYIVSSIA